MLAAIFEAIQLRDGSHNKLVAADRGRRLKSVAQRCFLQHFKACAWLEHIDLAFAGEEIEQPVRVDRRRRKRSAKSLTPNTLTRFRIDARNDAFVLIQLHLAVDDNRRRFFRDRC